MPTWFGSAADVLGVLSVIFSLSAWIIGLRIRRGIESEKSRLDQKIRVRLNDKESDKHFNLPGEMRRGELARAELLGWVGMIPMVEAMKNKRYSIKYLNTEAFFKRLNQVKEGSGGMLLEIECTPDEFAQFDFPPAGLVDRGKS